MKIFDLHCDTPYMNLNGEPAVVNKTETEQFKEYIACTAIWIGERAKNPLRLYKQMLAEANKLDFKHILTLEGFCFAEDEGSVDMLADDGIRAATLTHNYSNCLAGGCLEDGGLTDLGKRIIKRMNERKVMLDLSHINEKSFFSALDEAEKVYISHSNLKSICEHPRNISDEQARALAKRSGIIGICIYPEFLGDNIFESLYRNIVSCEELGLKAALGSDFDGASLSDLLDVPSKIYNLSDYLAAKGFSKIMLENFFYKNASDFFKEQ